MNGTNPKKHYITAKYDFAVDATGTGSFPRTVTLANTDTLPNNAVVNEVCLVLLQQLLQVQEHLHLQ